MTKIVFSGFARTRKGSACAKKVKMSGENIRLGQTGFDLWAQKPASLYVPKWVKNDKIEKTFIKQNGHTWGQNREFMFNLGCHGYPRNVTKTLAMAKIGIGRFFLIFPFKINLPDGQKPRTQHFWGKQFKKNQNRSKISNQVANVFGIGQGT
jgi:hypothetical protein